MRFAVSATLDAIEGRLTLDPALARGVVDLAEVVRMVHLDDDTAKPASLLRLGHLIDALAVHLAEDGVAVYPVVARSLLSDVALSSNERMVVRRWADDGLVEVLDQPGDRVREVAELLGAPVLSHQRFTGPPRVDHRAMTRLWRCPERECAAFGSPSGAQPPPQLVAGAPTCPRHQRHLADAGPRPPARVLAVRVDGQVVRRMVVRPRSPVVVGRSPEQPSGVSLAAWLGETAMRWISRSHILLELDADALMVHDRSTNGTTVRTHRGPVRLAAGQAYQLAADDVIELYQGVEVARPELMRGGAGAPASVMGEAPTVAIRRPRPD
jgi:hypothetical protein